MHTMCAEWPQTFMTTEIHEAKHMMSDELFSSPDIGPLCIMADQCASWPDQNQPPWSGSTHFGAIPSHGRCEEESSGQHWSGPGFMVNECPRASELAKEKQKSGTTGYYLSVALLDPTLHWRSASSSSLNLSSTSCVPTFLWDGAQLGVQLRCFACTLFISTVA